MGQMMTTENVEYMAKIGRRIYRARKQLGMSQEDLSKALGMTRSRFANLESGRISINVANVVKVCVALKVDAGAMLCDGADHFEKSILDRAIVNAEKTLELAKQERAALDDC